MAESTNVDLLAPFEADTLLEVRTSRMKRMPGLKVESGIDKAIRNGPIQIGKLGLEDDEHDLTFHGGPDKAILGYCSSHYPQWRKTHPERVDRFVPGGFGENFVTKHMNERNVCIGDVISVGPVVLLQVSLPRMPCYKLNHRFSLKNFAPTTYETSRTGWYYRVLREGSVEVGDQLRLVERKWPQWTIERIQEYLHRDKDNFEMNEQLAGVTELGEESRGQFRNRVAKAKNKAKQKDDDIVPWREFRISKRERETPRIASLVLEAVTPAPDLENPRLGAHAKLKLPNGLVRSYSVVSGDETGSTANNRLELGVALEENSRGGSLYLHKTAKVGDIVHVGKVTTDIKPASSASNHVFIVGGIGITAFLALIKAMRGVNFNHEIHYAVRSADDIPFRERVDELSDNFTIYDKSKGERMDIDNVVKMMSWNSNLYACGPTRMMDATKAAVTKHGISSSEVHYEAFSADISGDPFDVEVANKDGKLLHVNEHESLLEALRREYKDYPSSCEVGNCGTCKVTLQSGRVDHRGTALSVEEQATSMLSCVSRGIGRIAIEI